MRLFRWKSESPDSVASLERAIAGVSSCLAAGGEFIFDLLEPEHFRHWHQLAVIDEPDRLVVRHGVWDEEAKLGLLRISGWFTRDDASVRFDQTLRGRSFLPADVVDRLRKWNFEPRAFELQAGPCCPWDPAGTSGRSLYRAVKR